MNDFTLTPNLRIDQSDPRYGAFHSAVFADPRVTDLEQAARYVGGTSTNGGRTWEPIPMPAGWESVCGGHVQCEVASALLSGRLVAADGLVRIITHGDEMSRWYPAGGHS